MNSFKETNFRRIAERPEYASRRDYLEYMVTINQESGVKDKNSRYMLQTGAFDKFQGTYHDNTGTTVSPKNHQRDLKGSPLAHLQDKV